MAYYQRTRLDDVMQRIVDMAAATGNADPMEVDQFVDVVFEADDVQIELPHLIWEANLHIGVEPDSVTNQDELQAYCCLRAQTRLGCAEGDEDEPV